MSLICLIQPLCLPNAGLTGMCQHAQLSCLFGYIYMSLSILLKELLLLCIHTHINFSYRQIGSNIHTHSLNLRGFSSLTVDKYPSLLFLYGMTWKYSVVSLRFLNGNGAQDDSPMVPSFPRVPSLLAWHVQSYQGAQPKT